MNTLDGKYSVYEHYRKGEGRAASDTSRLIVTSDILSDAKAAAVELLREKALHPRAGETFLAMVVQDAQRTIFYELSVPK